MKYIFCSQSKSSRNCRVFGFTTAYGTTKPPLTFKAQLREIWRHKHLNPLPIPTTFHRYFIKIFFIFILTMISFSKILVFNIFSRIIPISFLKSPLNPLRRCLFVSIFNHCFYVCPYFTCYMIIFCFIG